MQHQEIEAPRELQDTIRCFWHNSMDYGAVESGFEVMPDGYAEIIFYFGSECSIAYEGSLRLLPSPFMVGLLNRPVVFYAKNRLEIIGIRCYPWTVFDLLGLPSGKDSVRVFEHPISRLQPILNQWVEAGRIDEALEEVKQYFIKARSEVAVDSMLYKAGAAMIEAAGTMQVTAVASAAHATVRTLERKFKLAAGHTVKDVSALMRFEQVRNHLWLYPNANLARLALELGYTDQSHLSREFKRYSGTTPAAFARNARRGQQSIGSDFVAFVQS